MLVYQSVTKTENDDVPARKPPFPRVRVADKTECEMVKGKNRFDKLESCCVIYLFMTSLTETDWFCGKDETDNPQWTKKNKTCEK